MVQTASPRRRRGWPVKSISSCGPLSSLDRFHVRASYTVIDPSKLATASFFPSGDHAETIAAPSVRKNAASRPEATSHTRTAPRPL